MSHESLYSLNLKLLSSNENLYIEKINNGNSKKDSGFDLFVPENIIIPAGKIVLINMKVKCAVSKKVWNNEYQKWKLDVPSPYYLYARSSVSKRGIMLVNSVGCSLIVSVYLTQKFLALVCQETLVFLQSMSVVKSQLL